MKKILRPYYHKIRSIVSGDDWAEKIRPIAWYNAPSWIIETVSEDMRTSRPSQHRSFSFSRFQHLLSPNLDNPIFIVGAPRSGTTFLGKCISTLPEISYHFEPVLTKAATRYVYENLWDQSFSQWVYRSAYAWLMRIHFDADLRFADKTPQISLIIPFLHRTFPNAKFVHIIRDGRDAALSLSKRPWYRNDMKGSGAKEPDGYPFGPKARFWVEPKRIQEYETTDDLHRCIWLWKRYLEIIFEAVPELPQDQYHELRYESLVHQPTLEAERLISFLDIRDSSSGQLFKENLVRQASPGSVGNWKNELLSEQLTKLEAEAGQMLMGLDYLM